MKISVGLIAGATLAGLLLLGCGGSAPPLPMSPEDIAARKAVDAAFLKYRQHLQTKEADSVLTDLSSESIDWLSDMRHAARTEPLDYLSNRPFFEVLFILALRVDRRVNPAFDDRPSGIMEKLIIENPPIAKAILKTELGNTHVHGLTADIGLDDAPDVPVFFYAKEEGRWKFHLEKSLPLILHGAESLARYRYSTTLEQAKYILEAFGDRRLLPEDLKR